MYYYMFTDSTPLEGKGDDFVNGYDVNDRLHYLKNKQLLLSQAFPRIGLDNDEEEELADLENIISNEEEEAKEEAKKDKDQETHLTDLKNTEEQPDIEEYVNSLDRSSDDFKDLLVLNNNLGYYARTKAAEKWIGTDPKQSNPVGNECGWILEYYFGKFILPKYYGATIEPSRTRYDTRNEFYAPWDFVSSKWSVEIKTQIQGNNTKKAYLCPESKFTRDLPTTDEFDVWWAEVESAQDVVNNRETCPRDWKVFNCNKKRWWEIYKEKQEFSSGATPKLAYKQRIYDANMGNFLVNKIALVVPPMYGTQTGDQLMFTPSLLESITITGDISG